MSPDIVGRNKAECAAQMLNGVLATGGGVLRDTCARAKDIAIKVSARDAVGCRRFNQQDALILLRDLGHHDGHSARGTALQDVHALVLNQGACLLAARGRVARVVFDEQLDGPTREVMTPTLIDEEPLSSSLNCPKNVFGMVSSPRLKTTPRTSASSSHRALSV